MMSKVIPQSINNYCATCYSCGRLRGRVQRLARLDRVGLRTLVISAMDEHGALNKEGVLMKIYRSVCTYIWNDDKFPFASDDCQLVWFHIFTNPLSSPLGVFKASLAGLAEDKNRNGTWTLARYKKAFQEALREGFLDYDEKALLVSFPKYFSKDHACNHPRSPNVVKSWGMRFKELPKSRLKTNCYESLKVLLEDMHQGFMKAFTKAFTEYGRKTSLIPDPNPKPDLNPLPIVSLLPLKRARARKVKTEFPDDWVLSEDEKQQAVALGLNPLQEFAKCRDHFKATGEMKKDWSATWRNWTRRAVEFKEQRR